MQNNKSTQPNTKYNFTSETYKICAGRNCNGFGTKRFEIIYIHKIAWFCDNCARDLLDLKLVNETE